MTVNLTSEKCTVCEGFGFIDHGNGNSHTCMNCEGRGMTSGTKPTVSSNPNGLRELPPEFDDSAREAMRTKARRTKPEHESMGGMSDEWLANELRMLSRHDLWHEPFCTAARDRIMRLSIQLAEARGIIDALKSRSDETRAGRLAAGTKVRLTGPLFPGSPRTGWEIENIDEPRDLRYRVRHPNGSLCDVLAEHVLVDEPHELKAEGGTP